jgi:hypothetical protein
MHCAGSHVGPVQSPAYLCRTLADLDSLRVHWHQAHLRHCSKPLLPDCDGPNRTDGRPKEVTPFPPGQVFFLGSDVNYTKTFWRLLIRG